MLFDLIAMLCAGAGLAGVVLAIRWLAKGRLPKWTLPAAMGAGMLVFSVWNEYSWYPRVAGALPDGVFILSAPEDRIGWRPWTLVFPVVSRFVALDMTSMQSSATNPDIRTAEAMVVQRWAKAVRIPLGFDCAGGRHADLVDGATLAPDGTLTGGEWQVVGPEDEMQRTACLGPQPSETNGSAG